MGLFSRKDKHKDTGGDPPDAATATATDETIPLEAFDGRPIATPLKDADRERLAAGLRRLEDRGIDIEDLDAIGAGYDTARERWLADPDLEGADVTVQTFGIAIGEYLARHSARQWAVVTDVFGTDLGLATARGETVVVPHNLVGARWMRGETGWVPGVVRHLVRIAPPR